MYRVRLALNDRSIKQARHLGSHFALSVLLLVTTQLAFAAQLCHDAMAARGAALAPAVRVASPDATGPMGMSATGDDPIVTCCHGECAAPAHKCSSAGTVASTISPAPSGAVVSAVAPVPLRVVSAVAQVTVRSIRGDSAVPSLPAYLRYLRFLS